MIRLVLVAGPANDMLIETLDKREYLVERKYERIDQLWDDILLRGSSAFIDIDKVVIIANGFLKESDMPLEEQILNLQSIMAMESLRSTLYFMIKDSDLYTKIQNDPESYILFRNFNMMIFKELNTRNFQHVVQGKYDAKGLFHPDFLRKNEIDAMLDGEDEEEELKPEPAEPKEEFKEYADSDENKKDIKKQEAEERRTRKTNSKDKGGGFIKGLFGSGDKNKERVSPPKREPRPEPPRKNKGSFDLYKGIIGVTGDRQSGVSTTVANMAEVYARNGNSVLIIDLDIKRRSQTYIFPDFVEAIQMESRVAHGLLVSLVNPKNLEQVHSVVSDNIAVLSISNTMERDIKKFANRPFEQLFTAANMVNLLSFSKSFFDVVLVDMPFETLKKIGACLSYVDKMILCIPNTSYHLDTLFEIEMEELLFSNDLVAHTLMSKSKILLTKYNDQSKINGKEMTPDLVMNMLSSLEESFFHLEVLGRIPYTPHYEKQFEKGKKIVNLDSNYRAYFEDFMRYI